VVLPAMARFTRLGEAVLRWSETAGIWIVAFRVVFFFFFSGQGKLGFVCFFSVDQRSHIRAPWFWGFFFLVVNVPGQRRAPSGIATAITCAACPPTRRGRALTADSVAMGWAAG